MPRQTTSTLLMISPVGFRMNEQTAVNNYYQKVLDGLSPEKVNEAAIQEFDRFVSVLESKGISVISIQDTANPDTPDSIFPNNWVSFHHDGRVALYPMFAENRRLERREDIFDDLKNHYGFEINEIIDFTEFEDHNKYLEGTGSMILDRYNRIAYAAISERTDRRAFELFCEVFDYVGVVFEAFQSVGDERKLIYHTNVMMCIANHFAIVCLDAIDDAEEREMVSQTIRDSGKEIISISEEQTQRFAGNMLEVANSEGKSYLVMSTSAFEALNTEQKERIEKHSEIIHSSLDTIEACGGGSARCMMAEVFLPKI
ncbi:MAG: arginine deiminase-related protein [Flavobacteriales bacterium]|nr:arginine deiminase-related protein [Flavobacteriales bacterium]MDG1767258.1 arginine deiminase-related protein [Flavobacteriales bacterium]